MMSSVHEVDSPSSPSTWLSLVIGNSRLHWGIVTAAGAIATWDSEYWDQKALQKVTDISSILQVLSSASKYPSARSPAIDLQSILVSKSLHPELWLASVVPTQTHVWQQVVPSHVITLDQVPLHNLYGTLGIDRALALLGAGKKFGFPALVIDGGTALTFSGVTGDRQFVGGAIAPGLRLQRRLLSQHTAALPPLETLEIQNLDRWATQTASAIQSGIVYTMLAGVADFVKSWWQMYPNSALVFTGGDGEFLFQQMQQRLGQDQRMPNASNPSTDDLHFCSSLVFEGICTLLS